MRKTDEKEVVVSLQEKYNYVMRAKLLIIKVDICFNVSDCWIEAIFIHSTD